jgi:putative ABC transport system ATP-binding protein
MAEPIIEVKNLRVIYNQGKSNEVRSLDDVSVKIFPQEYIIIHGPSGCGKSTLLYSIAGLQMPTYGEVTIEGNNLSQMKKKDKVKLHRTGVGMIFQAFYLIETLSVLDNVCLPETFMGTELERRREDGMRLLHRFGIAEQARKFPSQLSGGQKQRVAIARSLINNPQIILADEPVGNLDSESAKNVLKILKELNEVDKKTVIMVTHNPEHLVYGDRIITMRDGKIVSEEINKDKRPIEEIEKEIAEQPIEITPELRILMRTFKGLTAQQVGALLVPYKAKQLLSHVLSELSEEQVGSAEGILKELLFNNIRTEDFADMLDSRFEDGGANWNRLRAKSFAQRIIEMLQMMKILAGSSKEAAVSLSEYLAKLFDLKLDQNLINRFQAFLKLRIESRIDHSGLESRLDTSRRLGGMGMYKGTVEKILKEIDVLMLLKYSVSPEEIENSNNNPPAGNQAGNNFPNYVINSHNKNNSPFDIERI